jgi:hypothetical protein
LGRRVPAVIAAGLLAAFCYLGIMGDYRDRLIPRLVDKLESGARGGRSGGTTSLEAASTLVKLGEVGTVALLNEWSKIIERGEPRTEKEMTAIEVGIHDALKNSGSPRLVRLLVREAQAPGREPDSLIDILTIMGDMGPRAADAVPYLTELVTPRGDPRISYRAIEVLGRIGPRAANAVPRLREAMAGTEDKVLRRFAEKAVRQIEGPPGDAGGTPK